jgi:hypothetical protein
MTNDAEPIGVLTPGASAIDRTKSNSHGDFIDACALR